MAEPVRRADLVRDQLAHPPLGTHASADPVRVGTTGTGDDLLVLAWSAADLARERAAGARLFGALGIRPGMRVANTLPGALATPGALLLGDVIEEIGALDVPLGVPDSDAAARQAWELVERVEPAVLVVDPATAGRFFAAAPAAARAWWRGIVWLAREDGVARAAPPAGFAGWQRGWLALPEASSFFARSCAAERWHVADGVAVDVADGALVVRAGTVRYASGVRARLAPGCTCGEPGAVVELA